MKCKKICFAMCAILIVLNVFFINGVLALTDVQEKAADLNGDGKITQDDLNLMLEIGYPERPKDGVEGDEDSNYIMNDFKNISTLPSGSLGNWSVIWDKSYTKEDFVKIVKNFTPRNTKLSKRSVRDCYKKYFVKNAENFFDICIKYNIDPRFIFCIGIHESGYGTSNIANSKGNFFGWGAYDSSPMESAVDFDDMSGGIEAVAKGIAEDYISPSGKYYKDIINNGFDPTTVDGIGYIYTPTDKSWADNVKYYMTKIFGYTGGTAGSGAGDGSSSSASGNGYTKVYTVGSKKYKEFRQASGSYASHRYSEGTIASSGCGPTSSAIVASGYGKDFNPGTLVDAACQKYGVSNFVASPDATGKMLTTAGLTYRMVTSVSASQLKSHLSSGKPVVLSVNSSCGGLFTNNTHYIAILDIRGDQAYVSNPNTRKATGWIDINKIVQCNSGRAAFLIN